MPLLVTSAAEANGDGLGALLVDSEGGLLGRFSDDARIVDPRGLVVNRSEDFCSSTAAAIECWRSVPMGRWCATLAT